MNEAEFVVIGMSCAHCERAVEAEVRQIPGVREVDVSAADGRLVVTSDVPVPIGTISAAVDEAGYELVRAGRPAEPRA